MIKGVFSTLIFGCERKLKVIKGVFSTLIA